MSKQLNVDLNELINFNYNKFTLEEKQKLTAKITALSLFLLDKKGQYQVPSEVNVDFDESLDESTSGTYFNKKVYLSHIIVENRKNSLYAYFEHIINVAHETCHLGQDANNSLYKNIIYDFRHFKYILLHPFTKNFQDNADLDNFILAFYYLQPHELEAQKFSIEILEYIFNNCDKDKVNKNKLEKLKIIIEAKKEDLYSETEMYIDCINDKENRRDFVLIAQNYKNRLLEEQPYLFETIKNFNIRNYLNDNDQDLYYALMFTIFSLINALEIDYDENLANNLFDAVADSSLPSDKKNVVLYNIVAYTNFKPSPEQEKHLTKRCLKNSSFSGTLEDLYNSKEKTMAIINNLFDKEQLHLQTTTQNN